MRAGTGGGSLRFQCISAGSLAFTCRLPSRGKGRGRELGGGRREGERGPSWPGERRALWPGWSRMEVPVQKCCSTATETMFKCDFFSQETKSV